MATWTTGSPALGETISTALSKIRDNWTVLATAWNGDHETLTGDGTASTRHNQVTLPEQGAAPANAANTGFLYTKDVSGVTELFYEDEAGNELQLSGDVTGAVSGQAPLPGGLIMKWGTVTVSTSNTNTNLTFPSAFATACYNVQLTPLHPTGQISGATQLMSIASDKAVIRVTSANTPVTVYWVAIGK